MFEPEILGFFSDFTSHVPLFGEDYIRKNFELFYYNELPRLIGNNRSAIKHMFTTPYYKKFLKKDPKFLECLISSMTITTFKQHAEVIIDFLVSEKIVLSHEVTIILTKILISNLYLASDSVSLSYFANQLDTQGWPSNPNENPQLNLIIGLCALYGYGQNIDHKVAEGFLKDVFHCNTSPECYLLAQIELSHHYLRLAGTKPAEKNILFMQANLHINNAIQYAENLERLNITNNAMTSLQEHIISAKAFRDNMFNEEYLADLNQDEFIRESGLVSEISKELPQDYSMNYDAGFSPNIAYIEKNGWGSAAQYTLKNNEGEFRADSLPHTVTTCGKIIFRQELTISSMAATLDKWDYVEWMLSKNLGNPNDPITFRLAVIRNKVDIVESLIKESTLPIDIFKCPHTNNNIFHEAVMLADVTILKKLLSTNITSGLFVENIQGCNPFDFAVLFATNVEHMNAILEYSPITEENAANYKNHLFTAIDKKHKNIIEKLLANKTLQLKNQDGDTPVVFAAKKGDWDTVCMMAEKYPNNDSYGYDKALTYILSAINKNELKLDSKVLQSIQLLIMHGAVTEPGVDNRENNYWHEAVCLNNIDIFKLMLNYADEKQMMTKHHGTKTPLEEAASCNNFHLIELIRNKINGKHQKVEINLDTINSGFFSPSPTFARVYKDAKNDHMTRYQ